LAHWVKQIVGQDEFRFEEKDRTIAEMLATELPRLRKLAEEKTGCVLPHSLHIFLAGPLLRYRDCLSIAYILWKPVFWKRCFLAAWLSSLLIWNIAQGHLPTWTALLLLFWLYAFLKPLRYKQMWVDTGGLAIASPTIAIILLRWPPAPYNRLLQAIQTPPECDEAEILGALAHEYAHCLLRSISSLWRIPDWLNEGFADLFAHWTTGYSRWTAESYACIEEPEPAAPQELLKKDTLRYMRLMACYYWEVRTLVEQGKLAEALRATNQQLDAMRPKVQD
jgi:hypothetical protein